ncbi:hypothetical protein ACIOTI_16445 [Streptomyces sp. NPDC087843]
MTALGEPGTATTASPGVSDGSDPLLHPYAQLSALSGGTHVQMMTN